MMRKRTFRWLIIPLILISLAIRWQDRVGAQVTIKSPESILSEADNNSWQPSYPKRLSGAEHNLTPTPTTEPQATPKVRPQVSSIGIILGAIVIVLIIIGGVVWSGYARGSLKR
jgi:hypothetical protein